MNTDILQYFEATRQNAGTVVMVVLGLTTLYGKLGAKGSLQLVLGLLTGLLVGVGFSIAALGVPGSFAGWFAAGLFGLFLGLVASGIYETGKGWVSKILERLGFPQGSESLASVINTKPRR